MTAQAQTLAIPPMATHSPNSQILDDLEHDALAVLDRLDAQEQSDTQEFLRLLHHLRTTDPLQTSEVKEIILDIRLPKCLETPRERALYGALITIIRAERAQRITYQQQIYTQTRELHILRQAIQAIVGKTPVRGKT